MCNYRRSYKERMDLRHLPRLEHVTKTRNAVCNAFTKEHGYNTPPSEEKVSRALLSQMLGHHFEYGKFLGGEACAKDVPVGKNGHAKRAYCDATLSDGKGKVALIEFDEDCHKSYPAECELSRYHTIHHGCTTERKHTRCFRINTSFSPEDPTSLEDKVRVLAENIRRFFDEPAAIEETDTIQSRALEVRFLYYPAGSEHMANAKKSTLSLVVKNPEVTSIDDVRDEFKNIGLEDIEPATMEALCLDDIEQLRVHFGKAYNRCQAARKNPAGVLNAVQCSGSCRKHFSYCW